MDAVHKLTVVIPSYQPDDKLCRIVSGLEQAGFDDIIVIDDGSSEDKKKYFPDRTEHPAVTLLVHPQNMGKGAALKTAFQYFLENRSDRLGVVTADGDAQHRVEDILACGERMISENGKLVLGVRDFSLPDVPKRSRAGNRTTSAVFLILCGLKISDTQTGLRAIPAEHLRGLLGVEGNRYEYETNMLLAMKSLGISYCEQKIETVYIDENQTSHFRPVRDSLRIYSLILKFFFSSIASTLIDLAVFYLLEKFLVPHVALPLPELICTAAARVVSSLTNFALNRKVVFRSEMPVRRTLVRYYALAIPVMLISGGCVTLLKKLLAASAPWLLTLLKMVVDTVLYFINFRIQREWVFGANAPRSERKGM